MEQPTTRPAAEIQAAHDRLVQVLLGEVPNPFPGSEDMLNACAGVLCWVLKHDHNPTFAERLAKMDAFFRELGLELVDAGRLRQRPQPPVKAFYDEEDEAP